MDWRKKSTRRSAATTVKGEGMDMQELMKTCLAHCWPALLGAAVIAYLLGSVNFAIIVTKLMSKKDIRDFGSGNAGATNVLRSQGPVPAILTTVGDLAKSILSVVIGGWLVSLALEGVPEAALSGYNVTYLFSLVARYLTGVFCILGHMFPLYFHFRGGKGVLTTLGMMLILDWRVALICLGVFIVTVLLSRMVSLGSVLAAASLPIVTGLFQAFVDGHGSTSPEVVMFCTGMATLIALMLICKHIPNLRRIAAGTESRLGSKKKQAEP